MDEVQTATQQISDDQDLAKALAGISEIEPTTDMDFAGAPPVIADINAQLAASEGVHPETEKVEEIAPAPEDITMPDVIPEGEEISAESIDPNPEIEQDSNEDYTAPNLNDILPEPEETPTPTNIAVEGDSSLDPIKSQVLNELRPIVDKLDLPAEEKFETYLLLIRNSDDKSLIAPAHETALKIEDETKRAEALLDIIKEIEYLSNPK